MKNDNVSKTISWKVSFSSLSIALFSHVYTCMCIFIKNWPNVLRRYFWEDYSIGLHKHTYTTVTLSIELDIKGRMFVEGQSFDNDVYYETSSKN